MHDPAPFQVTADARPHVTRLLRPRFGMEAALILVFGFEERDGRGGVAAQFEDEHFMIGYYSLGQVQVAQWPRVDLCGQSVLISPDALDRLRGRTLALRAHDVSHDTARKDIRELLVAA